MYSLNKLRGITAPTRSPNSLNVKNVTILIDLTSSVQQKADVVDYPIFKGYTALYSLGRGILSFMAFL
jgi:hypothetical protein